MSPINIEDLSPEEVDEVYEKLSAIKRAEQAEERALLDLDRTLRRRLQEQGVRQGDPWVQPATFACAYPKHWLTAHKGRDWYAEHTGVLGEPGESEGWTLNPLDEDADQEEPSDPSDGEGEYEGEE